MVRFPRKFKRLSISVLGRRMPAGGGGRNGENVESGSTINSDMIRIGMRVRSREPPCRHMGSFPWTHERLARAIRVVSLIAEPLLDLGHAVLHVRGLRDGEDVGKDRARALSLADSDSAALARLTFSLHARFAHRAMRSMTRSRARRRRDSTAQRTLGSLAHRKAVLLGTWWSRQHRDGLALRDREGELGFQSVSDFSGHGTDWHAIVVFDRAVLLAPARGSQPGAQAGRRAARGKRLWEAARGYWLVGKRERVDPMLVQPNTQGRVVGDEMR